MKIKKTFTKILLRLSKNFYVIVTLLFVGFVLFIDSNDLFTQIMLEKEYRHLQKEHKDYQKKIVHIREQKEQLRTDRTTLERIARERYLLKRPEEDIYLIEKKHILKK